MTRINRKVAIKNPIIREGLRAHASLVKQVEAFGRENGVLERPEYVATLETLRKVGTAFEALGRRADLESAGATIERSPPVNELPY